MPQLIALAIVAAASTVGVTVAATATWVVIASNLIFAVTLSAIGSLLAPKPRLTAEQIQQPIRQATAPRWRGYGIIKRSGVYAFLRAEGNWLYSLLMIASQEIDSILEYWMNDSNVTAFREPDGDLIDTPGTVRWALDGTIPIMKIRTRLGLDTETAYSDLTDAFPGDWTSDHRLDGIFSALLIEGALARHFEGYYPSGPYALRLVFRAAKVWDPRDEAQDPDDKSTWLWSDNGALVVLDYLRHQEGMRLPYSFFENVVDDWSNQADICDEDVDLAAGGTEKRYRLSGGYQFNQEPRDVLPLMLEPMGAQLVMTADGSVVLRVAEGVLNEPDVAFDDSNILSYTLRRGVDKADLRNEIRAIYTDPSTDYQEQESAPWRNEASIALNGIQTATIDLPWCPSPSQARRRQKMEAYRLDPEWSGEILTNAYGLDSLGERFIRVRIAELGIDGIFEKLSFETDIQTGACKIGIRSFPVEALEWSPEEEEGTAPAGTDLGPNDNKPDPPEGFAASYDSTLGIIRLTASCDPTPDRYDLHLEVEWSLDSPELWTFFDSIDPAGGYFASYLPAYAGTTYNIRARFVTGGGIASDYVTDTVTPVSEMPEEPTGSLEQVDI